MRSYRPSNTLNSILAGASLYRPIISFIIRKANKRVVKRGNGRKKKKRKEGVREKMVEKSVL